MPRTRFIGNKLHSGDNYYETKITFDKEKPKETKPKTKKGKTAKKKA